MKMLKGLELENLGIWLYLYVTVIFPMTGVYGQLKQCQGTSILIPISRIHAQ